MQMRQWVWFLCGLVGVCGADWPQFLGPRRDSTTPETVAAWTGELRPAWRQAVGAAHSSPVVAGGVVYAFYEPAGKNADLLAAFDAATGRRLWENSYERAEFKPLFGHGPRATPLVHRGRVYTFGGTGILACWNVADGQLLWKVDTLQEFGAANLFFGVSASPLALDEETIVVPVGGKGAGFVAFDAATGRRRWQATDEPASYASPILHRGQLIALGGAHLLGLSPRGQLLWSVPFEGKVGNLVESSTTPLAIDEWVIGSTISSGTIALRLRQDGEKWTPQTVWHNKELRCYFSAPVVVGEHVYMVNSTGTLTQPSIALRCVEWKTGKIAWEEKNIGRYHAALLRCGPAGQERLLMLDDTGRLTLFTADPQQFRPLAQGKVCGPTWAHPALADGRLYVRDEKELLCIPLR